MQPSPSPSPTRRRRIALWIGLGLAALGLLLMVGVATAPRWSSEWVREELVARVSQRLGMEVEIGTLELGWDAVRLRDVSAKGWGKPTLRFDAVDIAIDSDALWDRVVVVTDIAVRGGRIAAQRDELEVLARRVIKPRAPTGRPRSGRLRLVPKQLTIAEIDVEIRESGPWERPRMISATVAAEVEPKPRRVAVVAANLKIDPGKGPRVRAQELRTQLVGVRTETGYALQFPLDLDVKGVAAPVTDVVAVAGAQGHIEISDAQATEVAVDLSGSFSNVAAAEVEPALAQPGKLWSVAGRVRRDLSRGELRLNMNAFELGKIPDVLERLPLVDSAAATVGGNVAVVFGGGLALVEGEVAVAGLNVTNPALAKQTVRDIGFSLEFAVEVDPDARHIAFEHVLIERNGVALRLQADVYHPQQLQGRRYQVHARVPPVPCAKVLAAIPLELVPALQGFELSGTFDAELDANIDYAKLDELVLQGGVNIWNCKADQTPPRASAAHLTGPFVHRVTMRDGRERTVRMSMGSPSFTPLELISPYMVEAVLTTEDGGFWRHRGFLTSQFAVALRRNLAAGEIELGASTITMQMVKNVLLSHERTIARKLQEMFLTWYVESALTKPRIMEIYLNSIEYGPGIYGITRAAAHYFGKSPSQLNPPEAAYLALMLPSPVRRHVHFCNGELSPGFQVKLARILRIMNERKRLSDLDYEVWKDAEIVFDYRQRIDIKACLAEISHLMDATAGQRALSGLLGGATADDLARLTSDESRPPRSRLINPFAPDPAQADAPGRPAMEVGGGGGG